MYWNSGIDWVMCTTHAVVAGVPELDNTQGFASGDMAADAYGLRLFGHAGVEMLVAQSYAKTMGLYGERVGTLLVVCADSARAATVRSQLKQLARLLYSNPPRHGAEVAVLVLSQPELRAVWEVCTHIVFLACVEDVHTCVQPCFCCVCFSSTPTSVSGGRRCSHTNPYSMHM